MRSIMAVFVLSIVGLSQRVAAQTTHFYRKVDVAPLVQRTVIDLFAGIPLDSARTAVATNIVTTSTRAQFSLAWSDSAYRMKLLALTDGRNSSLLGLLTTAADSARFATNEQTVDAYMRAHTQAKPQVPR